MRKSNKRFTNRTSSSIELLEHRRMLAAHVVGSSTVYATIQAAVNAAAAGGTVKVDAGTYAEDVVINKTLTVQGAQAGVDPRGNVRQETGTESIVTGALNTSTGQISSGFTITASNVTVDGFTVQGETNQDLSAGAGIVISPNISGTHILNNIVQNNVSGLFLANNSSTNQAVIQHNIFRNNNNNGTNGGRGIYTDETESGGNLTNVLIDGNDFIGNYGGNGTTELEAGIALEAFRANAQSNITISNNVFDSNGKAMLFFNSTNVTITGNTITNSLDWYSGSIRFEGNDHNFTITQNLIFDNTGPGIALDSKAVSGDSSGFVINNNNIYGNGVTSGNKFGIVYDGNNYDGTFDARNNYWGSASGPSGDGPGSGDSVYGIGSAVSGAAWSVSRGGSELYSPFSTAPIGTIDLPYWGTPATDGAKIQAEDFNDGGEGVAYHDTTSTFASVYRLTTVDLETTQDIGGGYDVGSTAAGEYLDYSVNVSATAVYRIDLRLASAAAGATMHVAVDGTNVTGSVAVPNTGGTQTWQVVSVGGISMTAGAHTLRVMFDTNNTAGVGPNFNWFQLTNTTALGALAAPTGVSAVGTTANVVLTWTATPGALWYNIYRGTSAGGEGATPIATAVTKTSYTDTSLTAGVPAYFYFVTAVNGNTIQTNGESPVSAEVVGYVGTVVTVPAVIQAENYDLGGEGVAYHDTDTVNQGGAYRNDGVDIEPTTDTGGGYDVTDVQAGEWLNYTINVPTTGYFSFSPRVASLNAGGNFHIEIDRVNVSGTMTVPATGGAEIFNTLTTGPILMTQGSHVMRLAFDSAPATYVGNFNWITIASVANPGTVKFTGTPIGTSTSWNNNGDTIAQVFDGNLSTFFDAANGNLTNWVGLDMGSPQAITQIKYAPRAGYEFRMIGGQFQASSTADFSSNVVTLYTITTAPTAGVLTAVTVNPGASYRYVRYVGGTQWVNIAEMEVDGTYTPPPTTVKITGAAIGTQTSWNNNGDTIAQVFDGNFNSYFDAANGNLTNWAGLDMGVPQTLQQIKYAPRPGYEYRMVGGQFQVSSTPDFSSNVVTLYTILTAPVAGQFTTVTVSPPGAFRYVRYVGGTQWVNIAEMEVDGLYTAPPTPVKLTGTPIGTPTSWLNNGDTIAQVFDGNLNTYFDAANNSLTNWAGLDLGSADTITQIKYAPRAGYEFRMIGGQFQVSSTPDFSSNVVTVYTVAAAPVAGQLTTINVSLASPYRYVRFVGGNQWVNIAEMEVDGFTS